MDNFEEKDRLIDEIRDYHPALCPEEFAFWADYTGGMVDSGSWHYEPMIKATVGELKRCLRLLKRRNP